MSTPGPPILSNDPLSTSQRFEFFWYPPSVNGANIAGYRFTLSNTSNGVVTTEFADSNTNYYATAATLCNGVTYQIGIQASNANGYGDFASFRPFQPGTTAPNAPSTITATALTSNTGSTNSILVSWTPPASLPDSTIFWYTLYVTSTDPSEPERSFTANGLRQCNYIVRNLYDSRTYTFRVAAVNCPGYSPFISTTASINIITADFFEPNDITGLQVWLDGSDTTTMTFSGSNVIQWNDKSGFNRNATKTFSGNPGYNSNILGIGGLYFLNNTNAMRSFVPAQTFRSNIAMFGVFQKTGANNTNESPFSRTDGYPATPVEIFNNGRIINQASITSPLDIRNATSPIIYNMAARSNAWSEWSNGTQIMTDAPFTGGGTAAFNDASSNFNVAGRPDGATAFTGNMGEVFAYNYELPTFYRQQTEGYLAWKWGLQSNLPATHPYRNTRPLNPGLISPYESPNLSFWLDATRISTISSGTALSQWNDVSSNGFTGTAVNGPVYQSSIFNGYMPSVTFNGTTQYINFGNVLNLGLSSLSVYMVGLFSNQDGNIITKAFAGSTAGKYKWGLFNYAPYYTMCFINNGSSEAYASQGSTTTNTPLMLNGNWNRNQLSLYRTGTFVNSATLADTTTNFTDTNSLFVGAYQDANGTGPLAGYYLSGHIGEILVYRSTPIESMRQKIEGYLSWKWGLTTNLPGTHPYKFYPPLSNYSSIAINTTQVFATNFNQGNDIGFTNFSNANLISSQTITGSGSAYNFTSTSNSSVTPFKTFSPVTTANATWCASVYKTASGVTYRGIIYSLTQHTGMLIAATADRIGYIWNNDSPSTTYDTGVAGTIPLNTWTHVALTVSPTEARFYINGSNIATRTASHVAIGFSNMYVGLPNVSYWPGYIDNVRFYASTLTSNEIQAIYYNTQFV